MNINNMGKTNGNRKEQNISELIKEVKDVHNETINYCQMRDFSGGPGVKTLNFHCRRHKFDLWSEPRSHMLYAAIKER